MFAQSVTSLRLLLKTDLARRVTLFNGTYSARVSNMPRDQNSLHPSGPSDVTVLAMASTSLRLAVGGGWGVSAGSPAPLPASRFLCMNVPLTPCVGRGRGGCPRGGSGARGASAQGAFRDEPFVDHGVGGWSGGIEWVDLRSCLSTCNQPPRTCCTSLRSSGDRRVLWHPLLNSLVHSSATQATAVQLTKDNNAATAAESRRRSGRRHMAPQDPPRLVMVALRTVQEPRKTLLEILSHLHPWHYVEVLEYC